MIPFRTQVKFFLEKPQGVDLALFTAVFQRWIQQSLLEGQLIDVADYRHVHDGPGIILIGHDSDYGMEKRNGRLGLLYTRKHQPTADLQTQLRDSLRLALNACRLLEAEPVFQPRLQFRADEVEIRFADRLSLPNTRETFDSIKNDIGVVLNDLYGFNRAQFTYVEQDPRELLTISVYGVGATTITALSNRLQAALEE